MNKLKIINVQFLRAIAALLVVLYHVSIHFFVVGGERTGNVFSVIEEIGYMGVDIFFVISGYIMWITTLNMQGIKDSIAFLYARLTRVYLVYWIFFWMMYYLVRYEVSHYDIVDSFFLTVSSSSKLLLQVAWTLQYELYFYAMFTVLLLFKRKYLIRVFIGIFISIIFIQIYGVMTIDTYAKNVLNGVSTFYTFWTSPFILEFLFGVFVGYFFEYRRLKNIFPLIFVIIGLITLALYYQHEYIDASLVEGYYLRERVLLLGLSSMFILMVAIELNKRDIVLLPTFSLLVGGASYSLYLSHNIILLFLYRTGLRDRINDIGEYQIVWMLLIVFGIVIYSIVHFYLIENPLQKYVKQFRK